MIDQKVAKFYNICSGVSFFLSGGHKWDISAICDHGTFNVTSRGPADLETAVGALLNKFTAEHILAARSETH